MKHTSPLLLLGLVLGGCSSAPDQGEPDLRSIYAVAAKHHDQHRNPVIVIPGILGSKLAAADGQVVWGAFTRRYANPETPQGARRFAHPLAVDGQLKGVKHTVHSAGVLDHVQVDLLGIPLRLHAYIEILKTLGVGGYRDEGLAGAVDYGPGHFTCFQFDYDWRRDNVENAARLERFIREKKRYVEAEYKKRYGRVKPVKFDIVAHSMGGILTRYFLRHGSNDLPADGSTPPPTWPTRDLVERVILVGTPNAGSANTVLEMVNGVDLPPVLPDYPPALVATLPSAYQLLPRTRHRAVLDPRGKPVDLFTLEPWRKNRWGLFDEEAEALLETLLPEATPQRRLAIRDAHVRACLSRAKQLQAVLDLPAQPPAGVSLYIVAGDAMPTAQVISVKPDCSVEVARKGPGDGTVLRSSALLDERVGRKGYEPHLISPIAWRQVHFVFSDHIGMTRDPHFVDHVLYLLLEDPRQLHTTTSGGAHAHDPKATSPPPTSRPAPR